MCGIAGIIGSGIEQEKPLLSKMLTTLAHRGPDDEGLWSAPGVLLGHRRLSILDLSSAGHQPMESADGRYTITFNGELYNYRELRHELEALGAQFRTQTDTEVILAAWAQWGDRCLTRFNGMWAFALWDKKENSLYASRDRFGKKPFYYVIVNERFYFASEIKALLLIAGVGHTLNSKAIVDFCVNRVVLDSGETWIREISSLAPSTYLIWRGGELLRRRYWHFPSDRPSISASTARESLEALLEDAVRLRLRADVPVGCLLSGGLDSSTIAALMRRQSGGRPIHLFTTRTDPPIDELRGAERLAKESGVIAHWHTPTAKEFWTDLPNLLWHQEAPFADGSMAAHFALMREARKAGVPVLLTGQGADEVFAGYPTFLWRWLGSLWRHGEWALAWRAYRAASAHQSVPLGSVAFHAAPAALRARIRRQRSRFPDWLSPELRTRADVSDRWDDGLSAGEELNSAQRLSIYQWSLPGFLHYEDRNSMAFGVETRLPFLDYRLAEALWSMPPEKRFFDGRTKALLRQAARAWVDPSIVDRTAKEGYPAPLATWLRELSADVRAVATSQDFRHCPFLNYSVWYKRLESFLAGDDTSFESAWRGFISARWYQRFFQERAT